MNTLLRRTSSGIGAAALWLACGMAVLPAAATDWGDEFAITQDPVLQYRSFLAVAPDESTYVMWPDWTYFQDTRIMLTKSTDKGDTWTTPLDLFGGGDANDPNSGTAYENMGMCADASGVHLALVEYTENSSGEFKTLHYSTSSNGASFPTPVPVGNQKNIEQLEMFSDPNYVFIYAQNFDPNSEIATEYLYRTNDGGETWDELPVNPGGTIGNTGFVLRDGVIHMVYNGFLTPQEMRYTFSADYGQTWSLGVNVSSGAGAFSQAPQVAVDPNAIHVVWEDNRSGDYNVMYSRSTDGGFTWSTDQQLNDGNYCDRPRILADETGLHVLYSQYHGDDGWPSSWSNANYGIVWSKDSTDSGLTWSNSFRVSQNEAIDPIDLPAQGAKHARFGEYGTGYCVMWQDKRDGNYDLYMRNNLGTSCPDLDDSGSIDLTDLGILLGNYGSGTTFEEGDISGDGVIDLTDLGLLLGSYGDFCP